MTFRIFAALVLAATPAAALDPSFDCSKAESGGEKAVCASDALASMDLELARLYKLAAEGPNISADRLNELKAMQRGWIKGRDDCWKAEDSEAACVAREYAFRIDALRTGYADARAEEGASVGPFAYVCEGLDAAVSATFVNTMAPMAVLRWNSDAAALPQVPAASGARYEAEGGYLGHVLFWTRGDEAVMQVGAGPEMACVQDDIG
ncbi:MliC family protein [Salipiger mucosus]|uniref:Lipoprotein, putative n=1 Tax=Salipiger mucosus DSM 16094 TaxID=1123237 RepID=S9R4P8_9RHOB|nr:MliC family protein [Salipiger mucosus]EPX86963.1 lipoprotein, putative [Salipiger mucosus DSM 16094]